MKRRPPLDPHLERATLRVAQLRLRRLRREMTNNQGESMETDANDLPECCHAPDDAEFAHRLYAAYNRGGERRGLNYQGLPCPVWAALPEDVREKWRAVAAVAETLA